MEFRNKIIKSAEDMAKLFGDIVLEIKTGKKNKMQDDFAPEKIEETMNQFITNYSAYAVVVESQQKTAEIIAENLSLKELIKEIEEKVNSLIAENQRLKQANPQAKQL